MTKFDLFKSIAMFVVVILTVSTKMPDLFSKKQSAQKIKTYNDEIARMSGEVIDVRFADNRTYMNVRAEQGRQFWVTTREINAQAGDHISFEYSVPRDNYYSSELKRSFPEIFVLPYLDLIKRDDTEIS